MSNRSRTRSFRPQGQPRFTPRDEELAPKAPPITRPATTTAASSAASSSAPASPSTESAPTTELAPLRPSGPPAPRTPPVDLGVRFPELGLMPALLRAIEDAGHTIPTPIQVKAIPGVLEGRDMFGSAETGSGKTAAFALPMLQRLSAKPRGQGPRRIRALVISPTRELASQIMRSFERYGRHVDMETAVIFGGVSEKMQIDELRRGVDVLVATPGRLCDLLAQGAADLSHVEMFVLDEADRMLDDGFYPDVKRILARLPAKKQTLMFSATLPPELEPLTKKLLHDPLRVEVGRVGSAAPKIEQSLYHVGQEQKRTLLRDLIVALDMHRVIVFTRTKHGANRVAKHLSDTGVAAEAIHGNKSQNARERALSGFVEGRIGVLVATDVAARGIDIPDVTHVVNYDLPDPESYVHRIGRTGRAGASGRAISLASPDERDLLVRIERLIRSRIPVADPKAVPSAPAAKAVVTAANQPQQRSEPKRKPAPQPQRQGGQQRSGGQPQRQDSQGQPSRSQGQQQRPQGQQARPQGQQARPQGQQAQRPQGQQQRPEGARAEGGPRRDDRRAHP